MYFPVGWPRHLAGPCIWDGATPLIQVRANRDRLLFAILTEDAIGLWFCKPAVQIVWVKRPPPSIEEYGLNQRVEWKPDSSMLAIVTTKNFILFYKVEMDTTVPNCAVFILKEDRKATSRRDSLSFNDGDSIPALCLNPAECIQVVGGVKSVVCLREELLVATGMGLLQRVRWNGCVVADMTIHISTLPFSVDLQHSRASQLTMTEDLHVSHIQYSPLMGGFAAVLSNGKAAFITANSLKFEPNQVVGVWAQEVTHATCSAINHKYTLMAFGCSNGEGIVYNLDELTGALQISHRLIVSSKDFPDAAHVCGGVSELKWTPDGCALVMAWQKAGFALWSVFGSLLFCSAATYTSPLSDDVTSHTPRHIRSMEWGNEGYHLWVVSHEYMQEGSQSEENHNPLPELLQYSFVKSALAVNPCTPNHEHLFLQGEDKLYLSTEDVIPMWMSASEPEAQNLAMMSNKLWQIVPIPQAYLAYNWPVRYAAVSSDGHCVAVAGRTGLAHYTLFSRKWKLFGNETQERDMVVTGGLTWWEDFVCTACYNLVDQRDEIRFYPRDCKLDNTFNYVIRVPSQIMLLNTFHNILIVLCADCHIMIFRLDRTAAAQTNPTVGITKVQEVAIGNFIPHPATVVALNLTSLRTETASTKVQPQPYEPESIIMNVSGRLLMFQRDRSGPQVQVKNNEVKERPLPFCAPVMVASCVENMWSSSHHNVNKPHLTEALWLGCGAAGMKVWIPLHPKAEGKAMGFMTKRIMLPFRVDIYPLAIMFEDGVILGTTSDCLLYASSGKREEFSPYMQLERTSQVYLHHVLRQLLRRNLGVHALEIASSCHGLPYFSHVLELLVHEVLEEEATSKEPIPDPLLPQVVAFVQEFPEYLQTVVHCARKTEVALWQYLFATVGNPKELFEECLVSNQLETAASYLIILQNLEKPMVSRQHATLLLDSALEHCKWSLARDLVRFLKAIDPSDADSPHGGARNRMTSTTVYPSSLPTTPPLSPADTTGYGFSTHMRNRTASLPKDTTNELIKEAANSPASGKTKEHVKVKRSDSQPSSQRSRTHSGGKDEVTAEQFFIDTILHRHARKLLTSYHVRDLASFAANLEDYPLVTWLRKERVRAARVEDFVAALKKLHEDFHWPLPVITLHSLRRIASGSSMTSSSSFSMGVLDADSDLGLASKLASSSRFHSMPLSPDSLTSSAEVVLQPQASVDNASLTTNAELSDTSSAFGELDLADCPTGPDSICLTELEQLSMELANKGPPQSDLELRYLFQMMLEAGCLEWALLIAIVLRDAMAVVRTVNTASLTDTSIEIVGRMREGMSYLELWADTECFGYKPFFKIIQGQMQILAKLIEQNLTSSRVSSKTVTKRTVSTSSSDGGTEAEQPTMSIPRVPDMIETNDIEQIQENGSKEEKEEESYECTVS